MAELAAWLGEGQTALETQRYAEAAGWFTKAAAALPTEWPLHQMVANAWHLAGNVLQERAALRLAFQTARPVAVEALYALGTALLESGAPTEARECFETVASKRPRDPAALGALASAKRADGDPEGAWPLVQQALTLAPRMPALLLTAAQIRHALGDTAGARQWLTTAEQVRPGHPLQQIQRAFSLLLEHPCHDGWAAFEARGLPGHNGQARDWHGEPLAGSSITVLAEQGLGDLFHFVRYVRRLEARGPAQVVVACAPSAQRLLHKSGFQTIPAGEVPTTEWTVPLLSLPYRLGSDADTVTELVPYLRTAVPSSVGTPPVGRPPRVGVVYRGNPAFLSTTLRDLETEALSMLLATPDIQWVWLQYDAQPPASQSVHEPLERPELSGDWLDTALLLNTLDAVVSVDSAVAHLAGALGIPAVVLLPYSPDWRWGLQTETSLWYPSLRLARQPRPRDWNGAVRTAQRLLKQLMGAA